MGDTVGYNKMRISVGQNIFIPQNESEALKMELDQVYARVKSRRSAMQDIENAHKGDYEQIQKEWEEELRIKAEIPAEAKAKYGVDATDTTPKSNPANVDNKGLGQGWRFYTEGGYRFDPPGRVAGRRLQMHVQFDLRVRNGDFREEF